MTPPDRWLVLSARMPLVDPLRDLLAEGLLALGGLSVAEDGEELVTYLPPPEEDPGVFVARAGGFLADWLLDDAPPELTWRWQRDEDWAREWKRGLEPRAVTDRIVTKPSWTDTRRGRIRSSSTSIRRWPSAPASMPPRAGACGCSTT